MAVIYIKDLVVEAKHGLHPHEKTQSQRFRISVELTVTDTATDSDKIEDTLNWSTLRDQLIDTVQKNSFNLIERLAKAVGDKLLSNKGVQNVSVSIDKLDAFDNGVPGIRLEIAS